MIVIALVVVLSCLFYYWFTKLPKNFPPGPTNYPIIGAGNYVASLGSPTSVAMMKLGEIYGPVSGLYLGNNRTIIINGYEATKEFYSKDEFPNRPFVFFISYRWGGRMLGVFFSNGRLWQEQRRFTLRHLRDFGFGKTSMEGLIHEEAEECINSIKKSVKEAGPSCVININDKFAVSILNILWSIMAGTRYRHDDDKLKKLLNTIQESFRSGNVIGNLVFMYPFLRHLPFFKQQFKKTTAGSDAICEMLEDTIAEHKKSHQPGAPRDFIDVYLEAMEENEKDPMSTFSSAQLIQTCQDLFAAGSESTSNSIAYAVLHMLRNPECQERVHKELDQVVGRDRLPSYNDKQKLPYTFAVVTESFRMSPIAPISVSHYNPEDAKLMGYDIPKGTWALVNYTSTNMDTKYWGDPENFRPERFLENGKFSNAKLDHVMGFGAGKRQCLGESLARISNFLLFTAVMQRFKFDVAPGTPLPSIEPVDGFTVAPKPFQAKVTARY